MFLRLIVRLSFFCVCSCVLYRVNIFLSVWVDCLLFWLISLSIVLFIVIFLLVICESLLFEILGNIFFKFFSLILKCEVLDGWFVDEEYRLRELILIFLRLFCRLLVERLYCFEREVILELVLGLLKLLLKICFDIVCFVCILDFVLGGVELVLIFCCKVFVSGCENRLLLLVLVFGRVSVYFKDWLCFFKLGSDIFL